MGIGSWFLSLGIVTEDLAQKISTRWGSAPLQWPAGAPGSVIYRLPRDPHQRASLFAHEQTIVVNEGEAALVLEDGRAHGALDPGRYVFQKARVVGSLDIVWVKVGQQTSKWGVGNVLSSDGIQISANGILYLKVQNAMAFNAQVVQGAITLNEMDLQRFLMPRIQGVLRSKIAAWPALSLQTQRDTFTEVITQGLAEPFSQLGLAIVGFEVVELALPPEFKAAVAQATIAQHAGRAAITEAQSRAQVTQLDAAAQAQAQLASGMAQVQIMAQMQAHGIDPLRFKALEAMEIMAEHPSNGGLLGGDASRSQLFGQVATAALAVSSIPPPPPPPTISLPALTEGAPASAPANAVDAAAQLERQLDELIERLAEGKITEALYTKLSARLEEKLQKLKEVAPH